MKRKINIIFAIILFTVLTSNGLAQQNNDVFDGFEFLKQSDKAVLLLFEEEKRDAILEKIKFDIGRLKGKEHLLFKRAFQHPEQVKEAKKQQEESIKGFSYVTVGSFVSCNYSTIQSAVTAVSSGETIRVTNETYSGDDATFNVNDKSLTIRGGYNHCGTSAVVSGQTLLDGTGMSFADSIIELTDSTGAMSVAIYDLKVVAGQVDTDGGGGLEVSGKSGATVNQRMDVSLYSLDVFANISNNGGGIHATNADLTISNGTIIHANAAVGNGGGVYCSSSKITVNKDSVIGKGDDIFSGNFPDSDQNGIGSGGGLFLSNCDLILDATDGTTGAYVIDNLSRNSGGGIYATNSSNVTLKGDKAWINLNTAQGSGGGIYTDDNSIVVINNGNIKGNMGSIGGGIFQDTGALYYLRTSIYPCNGKCNELSENQASSTGGALFQKFGTTLLDGLWIEKNTASNGGMVSKVRDGSITIKNSMVVDNGDPVLGIGNLNAVFEMTGGTISLAYSTVAGNFVGENSNAAGIVGFTSTTNIDLHSNIFWDNDPRIGYPLTVGIPASLTYSNNISDIGLGSTIGAFFLNSGVDYHIQPNAPAVDFGVDTLTTMLDVDGEARGLQNTPDAGADEANIRVGIAGVHCEYKNITEAIAASSDGDTIYISKGNYIERPGTITKSLTFVQSNNSCTLEPGITDSSDLVIDGSNNFFSAGGLFNVAPNKSVTIRNMTLQNAKANYGGIIYADTGSSLQLSNVVVKGGSAKQYGGGIRAHGDVQITNGSKITNNIATSVSASDQQKGAGIAISSSGSITIEDTSVIADNDADSFGGGVYSEGAVIVLNAASVFANSAAAGGGVYIKNSSITLNNTSKIGTDGFGNSALTTGGGIHAENSPVTINNSASIISNSAQQQGGGIYANQSPINLFASSHIGIIGVGNSATLQGGGLYLRGGSSLTMAENTAISYNTSARGAGVYLVTNTAQATIDGGHITNNIASANGGGLYVAVDTSAPNLVIDDVEFNSNQAVQGAGIAYNSGTNNSTFELNNSQVTANVASGSGGGLIIFGNLPLSSFVVFNTYITANSAGADGGGVSLKNSTKMTATSSGFNGNNAVNGGGVYLNNGADLLISQSSSFNGNHATRGGGIYIDGSTGASLADINNSSIFNNDADFGAGVYLIGINGSLANLSIKDSSINGNTANTWGGAIFADYGFSIIERSVIKNNVASSASVLNSSDSVSVFKNNVFYTNIGGELFYVETGTTLGIYDSSLVAEATTDIFGGSNSSVQLTVENSILSGFVNTTLGILTITASCNLDSTGDIGSTALPLFVDAANHDYYLQASSNAINQCSTGTSTDYDNNPRPVGLGTTPYDIGAYEYQTVIALPDEMFANGFE